MGLYEERLFFEDDRRGSGSSRSFYRREIFVNDSRQVKRRKLDGRFCWKFRSKIYISWDQRFLGLHQPNGTGRRVLWSLAGIFLFCTARLQGALRLTGGFFFLRFELHDFLKRPIGPPAFGRGNRNRENKNQNRQDGKGTFHFCPRQWIRFFSFSLARLHQAVKDLERTLAQQRECNIEV